MIVANSTVEKSTKVNMTDTRPRIGYHFAVLHRSIIAACKEEILELGIQPSQIPFIAKLFHLEEAVMQDDLSAALVIDKAATARALEQLEQNGFVMRRVNPANRRQNLVTLTEKAKAIKSRFFNAIQSANHSLLENFTAEETKQIISLLNRMVDNVLKKTHE